jgi:hypothetical protein
VSKAAAFAFDGLRSRANLFVSGRRFEVEKRLDVAAHGDKSSNPEILES